MRAEDDNATGRPLQGWAGSLLLGLLVLAQAGCAASPGISQDRRARAAAERACGQPGQLIAAPRQWHGEAAQSPADVQARLGAGGFSPRAVVAAEAIGADGLLLRLIGLGGGAATPARAAEALRVRQELTEAIMLGSLDVASALAQLDCEDERGDQLRGRLQASLDRRAYRLNIATILTGAGTAAVTGGLSFLATGTAANIAGIVGGNAEAGLGLALLFLDAKGRLPTPRNILREVWDKPEHSAILPASVWRYLSRHDPAHPEAPSHLDHLIADWCAQELLNEPGPTATGERARLLLGAGGEYSTGDLDIREAMMELLQASVAMMNQDLRNLLAEVAQWWAAKHPA